MITDPDEEDSKSPFFLISSIHGELFRAVSPAPDFNAEGNNLPCRKARGQHPPNLPS
jgi:hypothetical protein